MRRPAARGKQAAPVLVAILADVDDRQAAFKSLVGIGKVAVPDLIKGMDNKNVFVRIGSARALERLGPDASEAVPVPIERARSDTSISVRDAAEAALKKIKG